MVRRHYYPGRVAGKVAFITGAARGRAAATPSASRGRARTSSPSTWGIRSPACRTRWRHRPTSRRRSRTSRPSTGGSSPRGGRRPRLPCAQAGPRRWGGSAGPTSHHGRHGHGAERRDVRAIRARPGRAGSRTGTADGKGSERSTRCCRSRGRSQQTSPVPCICYASRRIPLRHRRDAAGRRRICPPMIRHGSCEPKQTTPGSGHRPPPWGMPAHSGIQR